MKNFNCIKCKDTGLRLEVNEYVPCDCEFGKAIQARLDAEKAIKSVGKEPNPILAEIPFLPMAPSDQKFGHELEKPLYSSAFAPGVARTDAERLRAIAATLSYNTKSSETKHTLYEIAMRLETGFYAGGKS